MAVVVFALFTTCVTGFEALPLKVLSPEYVALMPCDPTDNVETIILACPATSGAVPKLVPPWSKLTVPVGVPLPGATATTVAVNVTGCPKTDGFDDEEIVAWLSVLTKCGSPADVLAVKFALPA